MSKVLNTVAMCLVFGCGLLACSDDYYGDEPEPGDVPDTTIEQAFPDELFVVEADTANEVNVVATYSPGFGQICMVYGIADTGVVGGKPDLTDVPVYTAQVLQAPDEEEGYYFYGKMYQWIEVDEIWQTFGSYEYHPNWVVPSIKVKPDSLNPITMERSDFEIATYMETLKDCRTLGGDSTSAP